MEFFNQVCLESRLDRYLNFKSDHPIEHKYSVVKSLMDRAEKLSSTQPDKQLEIKHIKQSLVLNIYTRSFIDLEENQSCMENTTV